MTRYIGVRAPGAPFEPMSDLATKARTHGWEVGIAPMMDTGATFADACRAALRKPERSAVLHIEAHGTWLDHDTWGVTTVPGRDGPADPDAWWPSSADDARLLTPGLLVVGACWGGHERAAAALSAVFAQDTLLLGSRRPTTTAQLMRIVAPVVLAGLGVEPASVRRVMDAELQAATRYGVDEHWRLTTLAEGAARADAAEGRRTR